MLFEILLYNMKHFSWDLLILPVFGIESHSIQLKIRQLNFFSI